MEKGWDRRALFDLGSISPQKDARAGFQFFFHNVLHTTFLAPLIKKMKTYFALLSFWTFAQCGLQVKKFKY